MTDIADIQYLCQILDDDFAKVARPVSTTVKQVDDNEHKKEIIIEYVPIVNQQVFYKVLCRVMNRFDRILHSHNATHAENWGNISYTGMKLFIEIPADIDISNLATLYKMAIKD